MPTLLTERERNIMCGDDEISENVRKKQDRVLRKLKDRGMSFLDLEVETGIPEDTWPSYTITKARPKPSVMSLATFIKLAKALHDNHHDDLASMLIEDSGFSLKPIQHRERNWLGFVSRLQSFGSKACGYAADGIDHREDAELTEEVRTIAAEAQGMVKV
jgi:hypothetical protein